MSMLRRGFAENATLAEIDSALRQSVTRALEACDEALPAIPAALEPLSANRMKARQFQELSSFGSWQALRDSLKLKARMVPGTI